MFGSFERAHFGGNIEDLIGEFAFQCPDSNKIIYWFMFILPFNQHYSQNSKKNHQDLGS